MQKLERRNTYTPTDIPHIRSNCDRLLNREETLSVSGLKTFPNNSDAALTATEQAVHNDVFLSNVKEMSKLTTKIVSG